MPNLPTSPSASDVAEASKHGSAWVQVIQPHGITFGLGNGNYAFNIGDYVLVPKHTVNQLRLDKMIA